MNEIKMIPNSLYKQKVVKIEEYKLEKNKKLLEQIGLINEKFIKINSYDYGGFQYHEYNNNLGEGRSGSYFFEGKLINLKGIGRTYFTRSKNLKGKISDKEIEKEIINHQILEKQGIKNVKILGFLENKDKKILVRSNKTFIRLGMLHKIVYKNIKYEKESILKIIKLLEEIDNNIECYIKIIEKFKQLSILLKKEKICHNALSSDNILIDSSLIDLSSLTKGFNYNEYYSLENQNTLLKIYLKYISPIFNINEIKAKEIINEILN